MKILNPSALGGGGGSDVVNDHMSSWVQTRTPGSFASPVSGDGTEITPLTTTVTPAGAGNKILLCYFFGGEFTNFSNVFNVSRNGTLLTDSADLNNDRWSGITPDTYDVQYSTTPSYHVVSILDNSTLDAASTYRLLVRSSNSTAKTFYLNRSAASTGADGQETTLSRVQVTEYSA